jgi:sulfhydrogenase subunit alpha
MSSRTLKVDPLARVEGEGALFVRIKDDAVEEVKLRIFEPPRFFEAFLQGRRFTEAPDITARICGICPVAYQTSSINAMEDACGVTVDGPIRDLRRILYCGEWIESHVLHMVTLHTPDFLGFPDAIAMAKEHGDVVKRGLRLKKTGNDIVRLIGGREIHPVNVRVGGFYKTPSKAQLQTLVEPLKWALDAALDTVKMVSKFEFPSFQKDYEFVSLCHETDYPLESGRIASSRGLDIPVQEFETHFVEKHVEHSTALQGWHKGAGPYCVGPLARYALNHAKLTPSAQQAAQAAKLGDKVVNPFKSIVVRAVETVFAVEEALRLIGAYEPPPKPFVEVTPRAGKGCGVSEAPRGLCFHSYEIDDEGIIQKANIVPPTSQNQPTIEDDLAQFVGQNLDLEDEELQWKCEQAIRNYDPCISCATHYLKLTVVRE